MGYSRKNTYTSDGWQAFLTPPPPPPPDWISQTTRTPLPPGFPSSRMKHESPDFDFLKDLLNWKQQAIEKMQQAWCMLLVYMAKGHT